MEKDETINNLNFKQILDEISNINLPINKNSLNKFSDLNKRDQIYLKDYWADIPVKKKNELIKQLIILSNSDNLFSFIDLGKIGLSDSDTEVVLNSIQLCKDYQNSDLAKLLLNILETNQGITIKESAIDALGTYVYLGELESIPTDLYKDIYITLHEYAKNYDYQIIRQKALEALGYASNSEINELILDSYNNGDSAWIKSAIVAMKNSADPRWEEIINRHITDPEYDIQIEAIKAVGEIGIHSTSEYLIELLENYENLDFELFSAIIWSLSQIGGKNVRDIFNYLLDNSESNEEIMMLEDALENLDFFDGLPDLSIFDFNEPL